MTNQHRQNISKGIRAAQSRRRRSLAMKKSWTRRRGGYLSYKVPETIEEFDRETSKPTHALEAASDNPLYRDTLPQFQSDLQFQQLEQLGLAWKSLATHKWQVTYTPQLESILDGAINQIRLEIILLCQDNMKYIGTTTSHLSIGPNIQTISKEL